MKRRAFAACALAAALFAASCSTPDNKLRIDPIGPSAQNFEWVVDALDYRCGSLDCHGSTYRNLRIYGFGALRLRVGDTPATLLPDDTGTSPGEVSATYDSIIALEPSIMRDVVQANGQGSDRLTFVRKGRGEEAHKGGQRIVQGDDADICVQSWLQGAVNVDACQKVRKEP